MKLLDQEYRVYYFRGPDEELYSISSDFWPKVVNLETAGWTLAQIYGMRPNDFQYLATKTRTEALLE